LKDFALSCAFFSSERLLPFLELSREPDFPSVPVLEAAPEPEEVLGLALRLPEEPEEPEERAGAELAGFGVAAFGAAGFGAAGFGAAGFGALPELLMAIH
jgi:hypothetical protein